jgi:putative two-component system response regulator
MIKTVLVVDDDLANRMLPGLILGREKYEVSECADGSQALKLLSQTKYDYVLLDISLPKISGIDVCKSIRSNANLLGIKIFAYTAHAMKAQTKEILSSGFDDILIKPINRQDLLNLFHY